MSKKVFLKFKKVPRSSEPISSLEPIAPPEPISSSNSMPRKPPPNVIAWKIGGPPKSGS
jgi:hypothetical protein